MKKALMIILVLLSCISVLGCSQESKSAQVLFERLDTQIEESDGVLKEEAEENKKALEEDYRKAKTVSIKWDDLNTYALLDYEDKLSETHKNSVPLKVECEIVKAEHKEFTYNNNEKKHYTEYTARQTDQNQGGGEFLFREYEDIPPITDKAIEVGAKLKVGLAYAQEKEDLEDLPYLYLYIVDII